MKSHIRQQEEMRQAEHFSTCIIQMLINLHFSYSSVKASVSRGETPHTLRLQ